MTLPTLLVVLLVSLFPVAPIVALILMHQTETRLLRIFSERSGVSVASMENNQGPSLEEKIQTAATLQRIAGNRTKVSIPVPGAQLFRKPQA